MGLFGSDAQGHHGSMRDQASGGSQPFVYLYRSQFRMKKREFRISNRSVLMVRGCQVTRLKRLIKIYEKELGVDMESYLPPMADLEAVAHRYYLRLSQAIQNPADAESQGKCLSFLFFCHLGIFSEPPPGGEVLYLAFSSP